MKKGSYYSIEDFYSINKIDSHLHYYSANDAFLRLAQSCNMKLVSINVDFRETEWMPLEEQKRIARLHRLNFPNHYFFIGAIPLGDPISTTMIKAACHQIDTERESGAIGAKIWKNVGMKLQYNNELVMIDNPVFHPLLYHLSKAKTPLLGHFGEPLNCWLPIDEMTVESDKRYYAGHPEFHMYLQPHMPSHAQHIAASDQMLSNNQQLSFVGAHLGSSEYSIDEISKRLDAYPNMQMDLAERVCHLQHQAVKDHDKVRNFMIKYQDRLLYGSDIVFTDNKSEQEQLEEVKRRWLSQWRFFTQDDEQTTWQVNGSFKGLSLPKEVIDKLYYHNACNTYPRIQTNA
ncbi:amidohydrolase family protein [Carboxylicivirga sediminis]|uniref:Amidohydrolase family protein n=1 Tax=Carboxylicivirga sediminis TaxID=2006564 RepID=A0A941F6P2_9BACT|nr:amidohydrolase family protein [Carboxylicivirga sediminis]MBR8537771.1 amidohydrolase family protein [Carboxylicivirga sediminis]